MSQKDVKSAFWNMCDYKGEITGGCNEILNITDCEDKPGWKSKTPGSNKSGYPQGNPRQKSGQTKADAQQMLQKGGDAEKVAKENKDCEPDDSWTKEHKEAFLKLCEETKAANESVKQQNK
jgi:hypothetical protein